MEICIKMLMFTFYAKFHVSVTAIFVQIFMKIALKCRTNIIIYTFMEIFAHFQIGKGWIFGPKSGLGKIPVTPTKIEGNSLISVHIKSTLVWALSYPISQWTIESYVPAKLHFITVKPV